MRDIQAGIVCLAFWVAPILQAQDQTQFTESTDTPDTTDPPIEEESRALPQSTQTSVNSSEDPEDRRRAERLHDADKLEGLEYELYGSVRLHAINEWDPDSDDESAALGDGASKGWRVRFNPIIDLDVINLRQPPQIDGLLQAVSHLDFCLSRFHTCWAACSHESLDFTAKN